VRALAQRTAASRDAVLRRQEEAAFACVAFLGRALHILIAAGGSGASFDRSGALETVITRAAAGAASVVAVPGAAQALIDILEPLAAIAAASPPEEAAVEEVFPTVAQALRSLAHARAVRSQIELLKQTAVAVRRMGVRAAFAAAGADAAGVSDADKDGGMSRLDAAHAAYEDDVAAAAAPSARPVERGGEGGSDKFVNTAALPSSHEWRCAGEGGGAVGVGGEIFFRDDFAGCVGVRLQMVQDVTVRALARGLPEGPRAVTLARAHTLSLWGEADRRLIAAVTLPAGECALDGVGGYAVAYLATPVKLAAGTRVRLVTQEFCASGASPAVVATILSALTALFTFPHPPPPILQATPGSKPPRSAGLSLRRPSSIPPS
jgi:hypothetical protein